MNCAASKPSATSNSLSPTRCGPGAPRQMQDCLGEGTGYGFRSTVSQNLPSTSEQELRELLKRCSPETVEAALRYRTTGNPDEVSQVVLGLIERFLDPEVRPRL